jgi:RNA polymerase sigma-70 factor (ECF subfamily)
MYTIASNLAKNELRDRKYFHDIPLDTVIVVEDRAISLWQVVEDKGSRPDRDVQMKELEESVQRVLYSIPLNYRQALVLCDIQGLSYEEAAGILGCSVGTVASRLCRARALFMKRFGVDFK